MSHNQLCGSIPQNISQHFWNVIDLSYSRLEGHISRMTSLSNGRQSDAVINSPRRILRRSVVVALYAHMVLADYLVFMSGSLACKCLTGVSVRLCWQT
jgi:hypothetical protein